MKKITIIYNDIDQQYYRTAAAAIDAARWDWTHHLTRDKRKHYLRWGRNEYTLVERMTLDVSDELAEQISKCSSDDALDKLLSNSEELRDAIDDHDYCADEIVYDQLRDIVDDADAALDAATDKICKTARCELQSVTPTRWTDAYTRRETWLDIKTCDDESETLVCSVSVDEPSNLRLEEYDDAYSVDGARAHRIVDLLLAGYRHVFCAMDEEIYEDLRTEIAPCSALRFASEYLDAHKRKFGEDFQIN